MEARPTDVTAKVASARDKKRALQFPVLEDACCANDCCAAFRGPECEPRRQVRGGGGGAFVFPSINDASGQTRRLSPVCAPRVVILHCGREVELKRKALTRFLKALLLFGLTKREQDAVYLQELAHKDARGAYPLPGQVVCKKAYMVLRGLRKDKLQGLLDVLKARESEGIANVAPAQHGNTGRSQPSLKTQIALVFVFWLVASCGDLNPVTGLTHVWMFKCVVTIWAMYGRWCTENNVTAAEKLGLTSFFALFHRGSRWGYLLSHIKWKRQVTQKICSTCGGLLLDRAQLFRDRVSRGAPLWLAWEAAAAVHHMLVFVERKCYHELRALVRGGLTNISLYIIDASKPLRWPRRLFDSQAARGVPQLLGAFIGIICHSTSRRAIAFVSPAPGVPVSHKARKGKRVRGAGTHFTWETADVNCTLLAMAVLHDFKSGVLKPHLHVQVDGGSDARGFVLVQLLALLVCLGIVERVTIASLIPGHTHEDIDAFFSRLWKALKTGAGIRTYRTWQEIVKCAQIVFPGWCNLTLGKVEAAAVTTIPFVWCFGKLFAQGTGHATRPCLSPGLKGLWGAGKNHAEKPSKFVIETHNGVPSISAFLSSTAGAPLFGAFDRVAVFQFAPQLSELSTHNLNEGWAVQHAALVAALDLGNVEDAGYTQGQREEIRSMTCVFSSPPADAFGALNHPRFAAVLALGFAPLKGIQGPRVPRVGGQKKARRRKDEESDSDSDGELDDGDEGEPEAGELDEAESDVDDVSDAEGEQFEIEDWLDRRFNHNEQCDEYLIKFVGFPEPEWTLWRRLNGQVPKKVEEQFDRRTRAAEDEARRVRKAAAWRAAARGGGVEEDDEEDVLEAEEPVQKRRRSRRNKK